METWRKELYHSELYHYGVKHRSGRYPYGSGDRPYQDVGGGKVVKKQAKRLQKEINKAERDAAGYELQYQRHNTAYKYARDKLYDSHREGNEKKVQKWLERSNSLEKRTRDFAAKNEASYLKAHKLIEEARNTGLYEITYKRRTSIGRGLVNEIKDYRDYKKKNGKYYYRETNSTPNQMEYDKTIIRKKGSKRPLGASYKKKGYQGRRVEVHYYG